MLSKIDVMVNIAKKIDVMANIGKNYLFYFARYLYLQHTASTKTGRTRAGAKI